MFEGIVELQFNIAYTMNSSIYATKNKGADHSKTLELFKKHVYS